MTSDKRIYIALFVLTLIATSFWLGSRYPDLDGKAQMGAQMVLDSPLGFDALITVDETSHFVQRVFSHTINWLDNNARGMFFGILFAAAALTLFTLFQQRKINGKLASKLLGLGMGVPLGVCVNCATPIAQGLHRAGVRLEMSLSLLFSSPTLNIIVLSILFSILPFYLALLKLVLTLLFILLIMPLILRFHKDGGASLSALSDKKDTLFNRDESLSQTALDSWPEGIAWFLKTYTKNLFYIAKIALPWMLVAGFLGALLISLVPWEQVAGNLTGMSRFDKLLTLTTVSIFGLLLPVPIAFDVMLPASLLQQGIPTLYISSLLFSLGVFSIYPFIIIARNISLKLAIQLFSALLVLSVSAGVIGSKLETWDNYKRTLILAEELADYQEDTSKPSKNKQSTVNVSTLIKHLHFKQTPIATPDNISIQHSSFLSDSQGKLDQDPDKQFERINGYDIGFDKQKPTSLASKYYMFLPKTHSRPIAAGDINNDGWVDVVLANHYGLQIYTNINGKRFERQADNIPQLDKMQILSVALVDINNNGLLDLVISSQYSGNFILYNQAGKFDQGRITSLPNQSKAKYTTAMGFSDLDKNGELEIIIGNHWIDHLYQVPNDEREMDRAINVILNRKTGQWKITPLRSVPGPTLTILTNDINGDQWPDILIGNDFIWPNEVYTNNQGQTFSQVKGSDKILPITTLSSMSIDSVDINNDMSVDLFWGQSTNSSTIKNLFAAEGLKTREPGAICQTYTNKHWKQECNAQMETHLRAMDSEDLSSCTINGEKDKACLHYKLFQWAIDTRHPEICQQLQPREFTKADYICNTPRKADMFWRNKMKFADSIPIRGRRDHRNVFLIKDSQDNVIRYSEQADQWNVEINGWVWNAKFADVDNDGWQDLYVANGYFQRKARETNIFYHNQKGQAFLDKTASFGLEDYLPTGSYVYADFDHDGDLDILTAPFHGPVFLYKNHSTDNHSISFKLKDKVGNRQGVGAKITIEYGSDGQLTQLRDIKASGGYQSFDPQIAHFGLGQYKQIKRIIVAWPTGQPTIIEGLLQADKQYEIQRITD